MSLSKTGATSGTSIRDQGIEAADRLFDVLTNLRSRDVTPQIIAAIRADFAIIRIALERQKSSLDAAAIAAAIDAMAKAKREQSDAIDHLASLIAGAGMSLRDT